MDNRIESIRLFFPAEVTGAYVAIQGLLKANTIPATEAMGYMIAIALALAVVNVVIYWRFYDTTNWMLHLMLAVGFLIWVINIDTPRFKDSLEPAKIELVAPTLLIFYTLLSSFFTLPKRRDDNAPKP